MIVQLQGKIIRHSSQPAGSISHILLLARQWSNARHLSYHINKVTATRHNNLGIALQRRLQRLQLP